MKKALAISSLSLALILTACGQDKAQNEKAQQPLDTSPKLEESSPILNEDKEDDQGTTREEVRKLMTQSDYISRVKLTQLGDGQTELTILDNYKGNLSNIEFPEPKNLSTNKEYLIFYRDDEEGNVVPTEKDAVIEVATKNDTILDYVEKTYAKEETSETPVTRKKEKEKTEDTTQDKEDTSSKKTSSKSEKTSSSTKDKKDTDNLDTTTKSKETTSKKTENNN